MYIRCLLPSRSGPLFSDDTCPHLPLVGLTSHTSPYVSCQQWYRSRRRVEKLDSFEDLSCEVVLLPHLVLSSSTFQSLYPLHLVPFRFPQIPPPPVPFRVLLSARGPDVPFVRSVFLSSQVLTSEVLCPRLTSGPLSLEHLLVRLSDNHSCFF